ncbi:MAG: hypothetical protein ABR902_18335 [Candidatus Korobacteraceae bacterium]|jgi:hypothetical protein
MKYDERLIGPKPSDAVLAESKKRLNAMFKKRFEDLQARRKEQRGVEAASFGAMRDLAKQDPKLAAAVGEAKKNAAARSKIRAKPPQRKKVEGRQHIGSVAVTLVPPFPWGWQWNAQTGEDATGTTNVDANAGTMSFEAYTGDNGKTAATAVAVGGYFQPLADNGILNVFATPSVSYMEDTWTVFDSAHAGNFIGIYVGQYTLQGEFVQAVIDQQIHIGDGDGSTSGFPLVGVAPCDSDHFYEIWVWAGGDAEADGWSAFWGSAALSFGQLTVPSISIFAF